MELLYKEEHLNCINYSKESNPLIEIIKKPKGYESEALTGANAIIFMRKGKLHFSFGKFKDKEMTGKSMIVLSQGDSCSVYFDEDCEIIIFRLKNVKQFCDCYALSAPLYDQPSSFKYELSPISTNEKIEEYLDFVESIVEDGAKCIYFFDLKIKELFFLFRFYYSKDELLNLFYPVLSHDITFSEFIINNYVRAKTVKELADMLHYSLSGFQKRFKKVFGVPAYQWMIDQRLKSIYHEINTSEKTLKEISDDYGFSSPSHFNDFCKLNFGATPGKLRKREALPQTRIRDKDNK